MPGQIVLVGHTSVDHIRNLNGERCQPGGAALYAAMGARTICSDVGILTAVGNDYPFGEAFGDFEVTWVKKSKGPSTEFLITYDDAWNASYRNVSIGPGSKITTKDVLEVSKDGAKVIHLAPMNPPKVVKMAMPRRSMIPPNGPKPPRPRVPPPAPKMPAHVELPIPHHEPPKPARPPKK